MKSKPKQHTRANDSLTTEQEIVNAVHLEFDKRMGINQFDKALKDAHRKLDATASTSAKRAPIETQIYCPYIAVIRVVDVSAERNRSLLAQCDSSDSLGGDLFSDDQQTAREMAEAERSSSMKNMKIGKELAESEAKHPSSLEDWELCIAKQTDPNAVKNAYALAIGQETLVDYIKDHLLIGGQKDAPKRWVSDEVYVLVGCRIVVHGEKLEVEVPENDKGYQNLIARHLKVRAIDTKDQKMKTYLRFAGAFRIPVSLKVCVEGGLRRKDRFLLPLELINESEFRETCNEFHALLTS